MPACSNCGGFVSPDFVRVFGQRGEVHACLNCGGNYNDVRERAGVGGGSRL